MKREKYLQIFNYLFEFSKIRSKPVRDIEIQVTQYPEKLWLDDIPVDSLFENIIRPDFDFSNNYWIQVFKPKEPIKPNSLPVPVNLKQWIISETLTDEENGPLLRESINVENEDVFLKDNPAIIEEFENFINNKWISDLISYKKEEEEYQKEKIIYEDQNRIYKQLFSIYNKIEQSGEEFELIIGVGLLNYKEDNSSPKIFRHFFTQKVDIDFEFVKNTSRISIVPNIESSPEIETDAILDLFDQFNSQNIIEAEKIAHDYFLENEINSVFDDIEPAIQRFSERLSTDSVFVSTLEKPNEVFKKPTFTMSPCLILRKRDTRSYTALFKKIIQNLTDASDELVIPVLDDLIGADNDMAEGNDNSSSNNNDIFSESIFFPKEYNDEQIEIVDKIRYNNKVLVQGPPGTGKSHTIANLICHLLANGKKVLVTAYTQRALEVLKEKLPKEFQDLAVNYLSNDASSIQELQSSVNAINDELASADLAMYQAQINESNEKLKQSKRRIAEITNRLVSIQEKATRVQEINSVYKGTLLEIAEKLEKDKRDFDWYTDDYADYNNTILISDVKLFYEKFQIYKNIDSNEFKLEIPNLVNLPSIENLNKYKDLIESLKHYPDPGSLTINCQDLSGLKENLKQLEVIYKSIEKVDLESKNEILEKIKKGSHSQWASLLNKSGAILEKLEKNDLTKIDRNVEIVYPNDKSIIQIKNDANILLKYIKEGNSLSGFSFGLKKAFLPKNIKERLYFMDAVRVNGSACDTIEEFEIVLKDITIKQDFESLSEIWGIIDLSNKKLSSKFLHFKNHHNKVLSIIEGGKQLNQLKAKIETISDIKIELLNKENINSINEKVDFNLLKKDYLVLKETVEKSLFYLSKDNLHPIKNKLSLSIDRLDLFAFEECLIEIFELVEKKDEFQDFEKLERNLGEQIPELINKIKNEEISEDEISELNSALIFKDCQIALNNLMNEDYESKLTQELKSLETEEKRITSVLASKMAWYAIVDRLQGDRSLRQHLDAWVMAVQKIGKTGKGKRAIKFRKVAQREMEYCKDSIPCWIMPLYKVAETIQPQQGMYDYAIIDEASQIGPDAIFLLFIAKNIIIVGDDKQTSPEYVGVDADIMNPYIDKHLNSIPFNSFYGTEFSFFDHAKLFCSGMTVLREHFRCMPEIIEFSNRYFYAPAGNALYPLKQYSEKRLPPLMSVYCQNGYVEGRGSRIINEPEAEKIVEKINEIISDERYSDKTIGVITLQGNQQARIIEDNLINVIGEKEFHNRKIICGNSTSFQGDERDIIFLSLVTGHNHNRTALTRPEDERRFNVAVSRAKEQVWLFHSVQLEDLSNTEDLRYKVLNHFLNYNSYQPVFNNPIKRELGNQPSPFDSWFEVDVYNDIVNKGLSVIPQYQVARGRYRLDLVVLLKDGTKLAIECDGDKWHGPEQYQNDIMRQKVLERCGWQFYRVRGYEYYSNRKKALEPFWGIVEARTAPKQEIREKNQTLSTVENIIKDTQSQLVYEGNERFDDRNKVDENKALTSPNTEPEEVVTTFPKVVRFLNLNEDGTYILTTEKELETADYILPIKDNETQGFLLQCYSSGHINKVDITTLLSKRINREYMNGLHNENKLSLVTIVPSDCIVGFYFQEDGIKKFKAHLTENIPVRDQLHLMGKKAMYNDFDSLQFKVLPLTIKEDLGTLLRASFTANGAAIDNERYSQAWKILEQYDFINKQKGVSPISTTKIEYEINDKENRVSINSIVHLQFSNKHNIIKVKLVKFETSGNEVENGVQLVNYLKPLGQSIFDCKIGDIVTIGNSKNNVKIIDIK